MKSESKSNTMTSIPSIPCGSFCGSDNCTECIYWDPNDRDSNGRQWCNWYDTYYFPRERNGCLSLKKYD